MITKVRTRFAPSPTGYLHVGGLRTALYNYLFAKKYKGKMILRIEDTDRTRFVEGAIENLIKTLHEVGLDYDEGPDKGGPFGPYVQSQRLELYRKHAQELIKKGHAYYCFCSPERLEKMRKEQITSGQQPKYDGTCRTLRQDQVEKRIKEGLPHVIRLKMPQKGETIFQDLIRGEVKFQNELIDDQILIKSDGFPTYHLANVIDDHYMQITHVIRGEEWLQSVPKHLELYHAFGWKPPQMAHLPLLLNPDRSKLSKRQGDVAVEDFLEKGYLPEALINFVALLGWNPGDDREFFTLDELVKEFSLERVNKAGAVFDIQKLNWMNSHYIRKMDEEKRIKFLEPFFQKAGYDTSDPVRIKKIISGIYKKLSRGDEIALQAAIFFQNQITIKEKEALEVLQADSARVVLQKFLEKIKDLAKLDLQNFQSVMKEVQKETGIKKQELWMPIRVALTGVTHGPELPVVIEVLGKEKIQKFVEHILKEYL